MKIRVHEDMNIDEVVEKYPIVSHILMRYGLGCSGCIISTAETIGEGIELHGLDADIILEEINMILEMEEEEKNKENAV
ncbi:DUF1858 domain-containing protein [Streptobacillus moniliformis]|uniref:DUF1858 domain-containing protein n=1 Tax=Streptobacillus moniliformis (strain ATCC 14647 / DSM 12112 / NCTC 10651 / 9901) TaxID=519441 RepID=D1AXN6_STRM9|nr:DUF1858 domain-containing protein [Streptobacillus moniliformis]ACZ01062.1 hypothetical protein Smon_0584 [Streptobacillus moniliformis DSM 12112]SQA13796.1 hybrid cluster protein-associated redox disulfide domain [Streptobacillus moniliformis]